jgi:hypothetical protein
MKRLYLISVVSSMKLQSSPDTGYRMLDPVEAFNIDDDCPARRTDDYIIPLEAGLSNGSLPIKKSGRRRTQVC